VQLDDNRIVIRERSFVDVMDLALRVIRAYAAPLAVAFLVGVGPMACLNAWLLAGYADVVVEIPLDSGDVIPWPWAYLWRMGFLIILEIPLATAPITLYLGQALFQEKPELRQIVQAYWRSLPQMLWYQVIIRAVLTPWVLTWPLLFVGWPYLSEVILLERNPWWTRRHGRMTTYRRAKALHGRSGGDLFVRWLGAVAVATLLYFSVLISVCISGSMLLNEWALSGPFFIIGLPLTAWLLVGYFAVVRFLAYLDLRIRCEGWEVELMLRAEAARLTRRLT